MPEQVSMYRFLYIIAYGYNTLTLSLAEYLDIAIIKVQIIQLKPYSLSNPYTCIYQQHKNGLVPHIKIVGLGETVHYMGYFLIGQYVYQCLWHLGWLKLFSWVLIDQLLIEQPVEECFQCSHMAVYRLRGTPYQATGAGSQGMGKCSVSALAG